MTRSIGNASVFFAPPSATPPGAYWMVGGAAVPIAAYGSDSTGDGTQAKPFATPQAAFDYLYEDVDLDGQYEASAYIGMAPAGSQIFYPGVAISGRIVGQAGSIAPLYVAPGLPPFPIGKYRPFQLLGDPANPLGAFLVTGAPVGNPDIPSLSMTDGAALKVAGCSFATFGPMDCIDVFEGALLDIGACYFGNAGSVSPTGYNLHIGVEAATVLVTDMLTIDNGNASSFIQAGRSKVLFANNGQPGTTVGVTILGAGSSFPHGFFQIDRADIFAIDVPFTGILTPTTPQAVILRHGCLETGHGPGPNSMPASYLFGGTGSPVLLQDYGITR